MARPKTPKKPSKKKQRGEPMIRQVLSVTLEQLAAYGFERLSVPQVAKRAGVNKTSVYRRWPSKESLVREALSVSMGQDPTLPLTGDLRADLLSLGRAALHFAESPHGLGLLRTLLAEGGAGGVSDIAATMLREQGAAGPRQVFARALAEGEVVQGLNVTLVLTTIAGALMHRILVERARVTDSHLEQLIDLLLLGIKPR